MLGIGFGEMILIAGIALVVIGPEKFPDFAKLLIRTVRDLRGYVDEIKTEVSRELKPLKKEMDSLSRIDPEKYIDSLTKEAPATPPANPSLHSEDQKVMDEAANYGDDPYGWQGETTGEDAPAAPEDTVSYGESREEGAGGGEISDGGEEISDGADGDSGAAPDEGDSVPAESPDSAPATDPEFDAFNDGASGDGQGNDPDVWTGR